MKSKFSSLRAIYADEHLNRRVRWKTCVALFSHFISVLSTCKCSDFQFKGCQPQVVDCTTTGPERVPCCHRNACNLWIERQHNGISKTFLHVQVARGGNIQQILITFMYCACISSFSVVCVHKHDVSSQYKRAAVHLSIFRSH